MKPRNTGLFIHETGDRSKTSEPVRALHIERKFSYSFENFFHPFVGELVEKLNRESLPGLLDPKFHQDLKKDANHNPAIENQETVDFFYKNYGYEQPERSEFVSVVGFPREIDLREGGPYANYNWELFFHIPLTIAVHLSKNQRFAEAQRWFHFVFDPTCNDTTVSRPARFWKFLAFRDPTCNITQIDALLALFSQSDLTAEQQRCRDSLQRGLEELQRKPFQPHVVARTRHVAYQYSVVMKYLDNLIAWGDSLFRQDTIEAINEAMQLYVLAVNILGERPQRIPPKGTVRPLTFAKLKDQGLDRGGNALGNLEGKFVFNLGLPRTESRDSDETEPLFGIGRTLYFCIPRNDKILGYWDLVADRLFKIRHCMNIEGVVRQLALFDPPIDPGMLVKAAAAGIDVTAIVSGLNQPIGPVRSLFLIQKALELAGEVRGLGGALLAAIEKGDGEQLALLRQGHEIKIQQMQQEVRFLQWKQSEESTESLLRSRASALDRYRYYQRVLGLESESDAPSDSLPLDRGALTEENFEEVYETLVGQFDETVSTINYPSLATKQDGRLHLHEGEYAELNEHADRAFAARISAAGAEAIAAASAFLPDLEVKLAYWGVGTGTWIPVGRLAADIGRAVSSGFQVWASVEEELGRNAAKTASYERRADEWMLQANLAARELMQIGRQIIGSLISEQIAKHEYENLKKQIVQSNEVLAFLNGESQTLSTGEEVPGKFSTRDLYVWMQGELTRLYYEYYRFAFDTARKAERTMKHELMRPEVDAADFIKFNYWDGGRKGLLSGEVLSLDIKRMEMAYHEHHRREYELTKHLSLRQLDPLALLNLKASGLCEVTVPEWLFDLDNPGHYLRRMKNVSLSIPSVTGPYTSVSCTLSLLKSSIRKSPILKDGDYPRQGSEDDRFVDYFGTIQSIVTSSANNDSGMFETNLRDERFLPFEGSGAISTWKLELPHEFRQFNYDTISDVVLHIRYTARQGIDRNLVVEDLKDRVATENASGLALLFSLKHDFPTEWHRFFSAPPASQHFSASIRRDYFPYFSQGRGIALEAFQLIGLKKMERPTPHAITGLNAAALSADLEEYQAFDLELTDDVRSVLGDDTDIPVFLLMTYRIEE
ncbi:MAG TPA: toxin [Nitrospiraceae bacterium]|nr:toxin [Nitrospiraceae bacterium]